jgi:hypothetical protein
MGEMRNAYKILFAKFDRKRPFKRPWSTWEDNIKIDLKETRFEDVDWIQVTEDRN